MRFLQQNQQRNFRSIYSMSANISALVSANRLLETHTSLAFIPFTPSSSSSSRQLFHTCKRLLPVFCSKPISNNHPIAIKRNGISYISRGRVLTPVHPDEEDEELVGLHERRLRFLCHRLKEIGIDPANCVPGKERRMICPMCKGGESKEVSLSVSITYDGAEALWNCFRANCGWRGRTKAVANEKSTYSSLSKTNVVKTKRQITEQSLSLEPLCDQIREYFAVRMISAETLQRNGVMQKKVDNQIAIAFTYRRKKLLVNCKYRDLNKRFWQLGHYLANAGNSCLTHILSIVINKIDSYIRERAVRTEPMEKDAEKILYGLDDIEKTDDIIIVEGEIDKLSMEEAGFRNCVSVPDGAPPSVSKKELPAEDKDTKYQYLWNCKEYLKKASRIILATDGDEPGQALAEELARRLGKERCWRVKWPKKNKDGFCKDANEVLMYLGPEVLKEVIQDAEIYPIRGLFRFSDYFDEIDAYYHRTHGYEFGVSTGWNGLNNLYKVVPGELTMVTGVPNSGKSEWIDALLCNINESVGWKFALCSMENQVREHARKLLEKHMKKPFFDGSYAGSAKKMSVEELEQGKQWLSDTFYLIRCEDDSLPSIRWVLDLARCAVLRHGVRGLVIDPYNELDHQRPVSQTETEYVSQMLTMVKRFAQHHACHVWFVAHPRQLYNWAGDPPNLYDISGSAHFINKCDNGIVIHRNRDPDAGPVDHVQVCVKKVRNKVAGTIGDAFLSYNRVTGEFEDVE